MSKSSHENEKEPIDLSKQYKPIGSRAIRAALEIGNLPESQRKRSEKSENRCFDMPSHARE